MAIVMGVPEVTKLDPEHRRPNFGISLQFVGLRCFAGLGIGFAATCIARSNRRQVRP